MRRIVPFLTLLVIWAPPCPDVLAKRPKLKKQLSSATDAQIGLACYYGDKFHGRKTASGECFDKNGLTAAHRVYPLGTMVRVTNLANGKSVVVRINDRGPYKRKRIIDLSKRAAREIDLIRRGVGKVKVEIFSSAHGNTSPFNEFPSWSSKVTLWPSPKEEMLRFRFSTSRAPTGTEPLLFNTSLLEM